VTGSPSVVSCGGHDWQQAYHWQQAFQWREDNDDKK